MAYLKCSFLVQPPLLWGGCQDDTFLASTPGDSHPVTRQMVLWGKRLCAFRREFLGDELWSGSLVAHDVGEAQQGHQKQSQSGGGL